MSTITKEEVQAVADLKAGYTLGHADVEILQQLARMALAALTAEPVVKQQITASMAKAIALKLGAVLSDDEADIFADGYNAAPPAPVVPDSSREQFEEWFRFHHGEEGSIVTLHRANGGANYRDEFVDLAWIAWKDSRAAMFHRKKNDLPGGGTGEEYLDHLLDNPK
ncbi:hypothetical protein BKM35_22085 [Salmonella enterica]|nr:hypothetical protein [Salmonella enterica]